jgi:hypothetical protein
VDCDTAFGLCDVGIDVPELGTVQISDLASSVGPLKLPYCVYFCLNSDPDRINPDYAPERCKRDPNSHDVWRTLRHRGWMLRTNSGCAPVAFGYRLQRFRARQS